MILLVSQITYTLSCPPISNRPYSKNYLIHKQFQKSAKRLIEEKSGRETGVNNIEKEGCVNRKNIVLLLLVD